MPRRPNMGVHWGCGPPCACERSSMRKTFPEIATAFSQSHFPTLDSESPQCLRRRAPDTLAVRANSLRRRDMFGFNESTETPDAIELLKTDHDEVDAMFK